MLPVNSPGSIYNLLFPGLTLYLFLLYKQGGNCTQKHTYAGHHKTKDWVVGKEILQYEPAENPAHNLWNGDGHIEQSHINPHAFWRNRTCQHGVRHGQYASPRDPDPDHRNDEEMRIGENQEREQ